MEETRRADFLRLTVLIVFAAGVRWWLLDHTEVLARDSIDYIRCAVRLNEQPFVDVVRTTDQAPGYPLLILGMSKLVRPLSQSPECDVMALSAQLVSIVASLLTIVPIYLTGKRLFNPRAGFLAALLFQAFPVCMLVTSDGLSEAAFFLFVAWSLCFGVAAMTNPTLRRFLACGFFAGVAYWIRPEGLEVVVAVSMAAIILAVHARSWLIPARATAGLLCGVLPFMGGYIAITGKLSRKPTSARLVQPESERPFIAGPPIAAYWGDGVHAPESHALWGMGMVLRETARTSHYYGLLWALLGIWWFWRLWRQNPGLWVLALLAALHALILWRMAVAVGYVSERHTIMIALVSAFCAGAVLVQIIDRWCATRWALPALCALLIAGGLPSVMKPLHANRAGHRAAGCWLADHAGDDDEIVDPFSWAQYYSGALFREGRDLPPSQQRTRFVVLEESANDHSRLTGMAVAKELASHGSLVFRWSERKSAMNGQVVVYRVEPGK
jgi:hypothetical protein